MHGARQGQRGLPRRWIGIATWVVLLVAAAASAQAQTPSPTQEWQYSSGVLLEKMYEPDMPTWRTVVGAGVDVQPLYPGAKPYHVSPAPVIDTRYRDLAFLSVGAGLGVNVLRGPNYRAGVALTYDLGRRVADYPSRWHGLGNISPAPVVKLFAAYAVSKAFPLILRVDARRVIGGADGWIGDLGAYLPLPGSSKTFVMFAGPSVTYAGGDYMQNSFGVTELQSLRSGLRPYKAKAGFTQVGFGFSADWFMTEHWLLHGDAAVSRLLNGAAHSPITERHTEGVATLVVAYMF